MQAHHKGTAASKKKKKAKLQRVMRNMKRQHRMSSERSNSNYYSPLNHLKDAQVRPFSYYFHFLENLFMLSLMLSFFSRVLLRSYSLVSRLAMNVLRFIILSLYENILYNGRKSWHIFIVFIAVISHRAYCYTSDSAVSFSL